jgi:membrane-bound lytic murein transglycosylase D
MKNKGLLFSFLLLGGLCGFFIHATLTNDAKQMQEFETNYKIYSLPKPNQLMFAGEIVPLADEEVAERYDRELLTNVYWQSQTLLFIKRAHKFFPLIEKILAQNNIPDDLKYVALAESGLQNVVSPAGASGYWQFMEATGKIYRLEISSEVDERYHIEKATEAACKYFKEAYAAFNSWPMVAASYNMGIEGVRRQMLQQGVSSYYDLLLNTETSRYVFRILAIKEIVERPEKYGFNVLESHKYKLEPVAKIRVTQSINDLAKYSLNNGFNYKILKTYNPWLRKSTLNVAIGKTYYFSVPKAQLIKAGLGDKLVNDTLDMADTRME